MIVAETDRLTLRRMTEDDAELILAVLTDADFVRHVGDRGVHDLDEARAYLRDGPMASYERVGYGLYLVARRSDASPLGVCGLLKRDYLDDVDIGYALLPPARGQGLALEAITATIAHARDEARLPRLVAIISRENAPSRAVAERAGMREDGTITDPAGQELLLYAVNFAEPSGEGSRAPRASAS